ncbi:hypothetical protein HELRODRAFT_160087 [Helobdella robusta]|uniref:Uncharacterized protein n=1 Tax=Helobdella robusta TaxID=6412 RepID=T1EPR5_HELRO|nr:hypothetical protein HELRODRAFT_160087 [Helobdella robusta]ESO05983.1 hypothetical protein HELRODRAFT_160087 [Helobdella robusta]
MVWEAQTITECLFYLCAELGLVITSTLSSRERLHGCTHATKFVGFSARKHQDWFDENRPGILDLLQTKNKAHKNRLCNPDSPSLNLAWKESRTKVWHVLRCLENDWWINKTREIQGLVDTKIRKDFTTLSSLAQHSVHPVKSKDGLAVINNFEEIVLR